MKLIISAGGSGGHIYPALAIIETLKKADPDLEILYIGTTDRMESKIIPGEAIRYLGVELAGLNRKNLFKNISVLKKYLKAKKLLKKEISKFNPDIVIGVGGYITLPVCSVASSLGYKVLIHEQNLKPGLANKILSKKADKIAVSMEDSLQYFPQAKTYYTGNPCSQSVLAAKKTSKKDLGLKEDQRLILIVMGSLGSSLINQKMKDILPKFKKQDYQVVFITGDKYYDDYQNLSFPDNVYLYSYLNNFGSFLKNTDLIISRAGATTIAEITALGIPSILIPSPHVTHNHQEENAKALEEKGASLVILEKDLEAKLLLAKIDEILNNKYDIMTTNNKKLAVLDSASRIKDLVLDLIGEKR